MRESALSDIVTIRIDRFKRWLPRLINAVAEIGGVDPAALVGPGRTGWPVLLRAALTLAAVDVMEKSLAEVGRQLGGRDHTTIICAYKKAQKKMATDAEFRQLAALILAVARTIAGKDTAPPEIEPELPL